MVRVEHVLESWKSLRADAAQAVDDLPDGDLSFRPAEGLMSFGEIARHILDTGCAVPRLLLEGYENFRLPEWRQHLESRYHPLAAGAGAGSLAQAMREDVAAQCAALARQTPEFFAGMITRWDGTQLTRLELLAWLKEHELTHRSQLFLYLRLKGVVPVTTRRREAAKKTQS